MKYSEINKILDKFSILSKMNLCMYLSKQTISINGFEGMEKIYSKPAPWEIEVLSLFSIYGNDGEETIDIKTGIEAINAIRENFDDQLLNQECENIAEKFVIWASALQFPVQENNYIKLFRCKFFYTYKNSEIDMGSLFMNMFDVPYEEFMKFYVILNYLLTLPREINTARIKFTLINFNMRVVKHFIKSLADYKELQSRFVSDIYDYQKGFRVFYQFPFISDPPLMYTPVPHLHINAFTNSLLFRLTNSNNNIRRKFGKNVLEDYLLYMFEGYKHVDGYCPEMPYIKNRSDAKSPDLLAYKEESCVLIDSKSFVPHLKLRDVTEKEINYSINIISEGLVKLYNQVAIDCGKYYNPFDKKFKKENTYGILLLLEDSFVIRDRIYEKAADILGFELDSIEYEFLRSNIAVLSLYNLEDAIYHNLDIFLLMIDRRENSSRWNDFPIVLKDTTRTVIDSRISEIEKDMKKEINQFIDEMVAMGLI